MKKKKEEEEKRKDVSFRNTKNNAKQNSPQPGGKYCTVMALCRTAQSDTFIYFLAYSNFQGTHGHERFTYILNKQNTNQHFSFE